MDLTVSKEDYIKAIYTLAVIEKKPVKTTDIAEKLAIQSPSVTTMLKKLSDDKLVQHHPYKAIELTTLGQKTGAIIIRRHRIIELFLVQILDMPWEQVHDEAENLEHVVSDAVIEKMDKLLGNPTHDPHGEPIPNANGVIADHQDELCLADISENQDAAVVRISCDESEFLSYLTEINIGLGKKIQVIKHYPFDQSMDIKIQHKTHHITQFCAQSIWVVPQQKKGD